MTRIGERDRTFDCSRNQKIQPLSLVRFIGSSFQGIEIYNPSVEIDAGEFGCSHQFQSVFIAIEGCASAFRGQKLWWSADERLRRFLVRGYRPWLPHDGGNWFAPNRLDSGWSSPLVFGNKDKVVRRWRFYANDQIGPLGINGEFHGLLLHLNAFSHSLSLAFDGFEGPNSGPNTADTNKDQEHCWDVCGTKKAAEITIRLAGGFYCLLFGCLLIYREPSGPLFRLNLRGIAGPALVGLGLAAFLFPPYYIDDCGCTDNSTQPPPFLNFSHGKNTVPRKYLLTSLNYWGTVIGIGRTDMANNMSTEKQVAVISSLAEGSSIRSIERITGVHRDTIMRLGVRVGKGCQSLLDAKMRGLSCQHLQFDEIWGFIGKKERHCTPDDSPELGDVWTFCAIDSDTKLVPSFKVGKRDAATANAFVSDVAGRIKNRVQISSDALKAYVEAVEGAFGANVDFAQIVKTYVADGSQVAERKYSPSEFVIEEKRAISGFPNMALASTSYVERLNGTTRLHMRRLTRLTYAFSKKLENFEAAVALHFAYYNFVKRHNTLRCTPAMAAGFEKDFWSVRDLVEAAA